MTLVGEVEPGGASGKTAQLAKLIAELGPDIPEISRRLGLYKESVRYRYKTRIIDEGMAVQAAIDHEKLGLKRVVFVVDFAGEYEQYAPSMMTAMSELCYVTGFEKTMPEGSYLVDASVPTEFVADFTDFLKQLEAKGLFRCTKIFVFDWFRTAPMRAELYDFGTGRWDFDWSNPGKPAPWTFAPSGRTEFDYTDLLIVKELRIDATRSMVDISKKLGLDYKKLMWHLGAHVKPRGLVKGYSLNWIGIRYDSKVEEVLHRKHRYLAIDLLAEDLSEVERMDLISRINALPFLWAEMGGRSYLAQLAIPVDNVVEAYQYLMLALKPIKDWAWIYVVDTPNSLSFTISYNLFDENNNAWTFNKDQLLTRFGDLLLKIKGGAGQ